MRLAQALRRGARLEDEEALGPSVGPVVELVEQAALADARVGHHEHALQAGTRGHDALEGSLQRLQLGAAGPIMRVSTPSMPRVATRNARGRARTTR